MTYKMTPDHFSYQSSPCSLHSSHMLSTLLESLHLIFPLPTTFFSPGYAHVAHCLTSFRSVFKCHLYSSSPHPTYFFPIVLTDLHLTCKTSVLNFCLCLVSYRVLLKYSQCALQLIINRNLQFLVSWLFCLLK